MKPPWLKSKIPAGANYQRLKTLLRSLDLHTVCEEARCPNIGDCWERKTATVMIMGDTCTRSCGFCAVKTGRPASLDPREPAHVAEAIAQIGLKHVVITSVDRDDLPDGGAGHFAATIRRVRALCPDIQIEVLIPDFHARRQDLDLVFAAAPDILNHNLETVERLQRQVRPQANYERSLQVLNWAAEAGMVAKSGLMLGLGESSGELETTIQDLRTRGQVRFLTLGQYLQPTPQHLPVTRYYAPQEFDDWKRYADALGFHHVASGPMVRSSYHADEAALELLAP